MLNRIRREFLDNDAKNVELIGGRSSKWDAVQGLVTWSEKRTPVFVVYESVLKC